MSISIVAMLRLRWEKKRNGWLVLVTRVSREECRFPFSSFLSQRRQSVNDSEAATKKKQHEETKMIHSEIRWWRVFQVFLREGSDCIIFVCRWIDFYLCLTKSFCNLFRGEETPALFLSLYLPGVDKKMQRGLLSPRLTLSQSKRIDCSVGVLFKGKANDTSYHGDHYPIRMYSSLFCWNSLVELLSVRCDRSMIAVSVQRFIRSLGQDENPFAVYI